MPPAHMICLFRMITGLMLVVVAPHAIAQGQLGFSDSLLIHASFDGTTELDRFERDGRTYTAESTAVKKLTQGNQIPEVTIVQGGGRLGDAVRFRAKTKQVFCYRAAENGFAPTDNWSGTVSLWMKLDPNQDLPEGFCDPIQITAKTWNDAAFFLDFDKDVPRDFRLGVFSDHDVWNPANIKWDDFPVSKRPMIPVSDAPFSRATWTHVVFTFANVNSTSDEPSTARLYLNGQLQGSLQQPIRFTWPKSDAAPGSEAGPEEAILMLGINYVGDIDELAIFRRALSSDEIRQLYQHPEKL